MTKIAAPRILISSPSSGSGKSFITLGLAISLRKEGHSVSCCVRGPHLTQATLLKRTTGRNCLVIDENLLNPQQQLVTIQLASAGSDVLLIEGTRGLFDGVVEGSLKGSDADYAVITNSPVILIHDASKTGTSLAAIHRGFFGAINALTLLPPIINKTTNTVTDNRAYYNAAMELFQLPKVLAVVADVAAAPTLPDCNVWCSDKSLALARQFLVDVSRAVEKDLSLEKLLDASKLAPELDIPDFAPPAHRGCKIVVSDDTCFNTLIQNNLEYLKYFGAEIKTFSPLADQTLPSKIGAVYLTGALLKEYGSELAANESIKDALRGFYQQGGVIYSEGEGTAFLCRTFKPLGIDKPLSGVGIIQGDAVQERASNSYIDAVTVEESVFGRQGIFCKGIRTANWKVENLTGALPTLKVSSGNSPPQPEGYSAGAQTLSTFNFFHFGSNPEVAKNIVEAAAVVSKIG